jgi:NADH-quinone oxidoreductase subunit J
MTGFYISAIVAIIATLMTITRANIVHALLYFIVSLLATASIFFILGAPFAAALVVIINAGAIIVLFVFVIMMLNLGPQSAEQERSWLNGGMWLGPSILSIILIIELIYSVVSGSSIISGSNVISPSQTGAAVFGPYILGVEIAAMLLVAGLLGAYHLGRNIESMKGKDE